MEDLAEKIFNLLGDRPGYELVQIRFVNEREENLTYRNGMPRGLNKSQSQGVGIRVRANYSWGFAATNDLSKDAIIKTAELAWKVANSSAKVARKTQLELVPEPVYEDKYSVRIDKDPFEIDLKDKLDLLKDANNTMKENSKHVKMSVINYRANEQKVNFYSSEGSKIEQRLLFTGG
ncbi:MAG: hypothetical protein OEZ01_10540, partial [Candidatus Heimdallarchaeota archaeon]|nr:hypothetical protein [Candidatus Heimdallarchaeota archaeon]